MNWFDWGLIARHADVHRFVQLLSSRRLLRAVEHERQRISLTSMLDQASKSWHGVKLDDPDWSDHSRSLALCGELRKEGLLFHLILNAYWGPLEFELPKLGDRGPWRRWIDTALDSPNDIVPWEESRPIAGDTYRAESRSVVVLFAGRQA